MNTTSRFIPYYRVSTKRQGESGLGLEAQQVDVSKLIAEREGIEIAHYTEIETGKNSERPELEKSGHRHTSHLFAVYPGTQISTTRTPELAKAAAVSLE